jgi:hypothetical protein
MGQPWDALLDFGDSVDAVVALEVFEEADRMRVKRQAHFFEQMEIVIHNAIVKSIGKRL